MNPDITIDYSYSDNVVDLMMALAKAQAKMDNPTYDSDNPHFRSKYASLAAVRDAVIPAMASEGIATVQLPATGEKSVTCTTILFLGNQHLTSTLKMPVTRRQTGNAGELTPQDYAAALTWARRIGLMTLCTVAGDGDDDGETASGRGTQQRSRYQQRPAPGNMLYEDEDNEPQDLDERQPLLRTIHEQVQRSLSPLRHAGIHKAVLYHSFGCEHTRIKDQSVQTLTDGLVTLAYLCKALENDEDTVHEARRAPDKWAEATKRAWIAEMDSATADEAHAAGPSWGPESPDLMRDEDDLQPIGAEKADD